MSRSFLVPLLLPADPTVPLGAATKQYVDNKPGGGGFTGTVGDTTDWDTIVVPGTYNTINIGGTNASVYHAPPEAKSLMGVLTVAMGAATNPAVDPVSQVWCSPNTAWARTKNQGNWGAWAQNIPPPYDIDLVLRSELDAQGNFISWWRAPETSGGGGASTGYKLTELTALTAAGAATTDIFEVVDVSDTTMAASGTNKKMTLAEAINFVGANLHTVSNTLAVTNTTDTDTQVLIFATPTTQGVELYNPLGNPTVMIEGTATTGSISLYGTGAYIDLPPGGQYRINGVAIPALTNDSVTNAFLANAPASTIKGNNTGASADPVDMTVAQVKSLLALAAGDISGLGTLAGKNAIASADITDGTVANGDLTTMATQTIKGRTTAGTGAPEDLTAAQARSMLASGGGALFGFNFDTTTTAGPASAGLRLNNSTPASATIVYITYTSKDGVDLKTRLAAGTAGDRLYIQDRANSANWRLYELTGVPTDSTTYATCNVVHRSGAGSLWANSTELIAGFMTAAITIATSAPASPLVNDIWIDTT